MSTVTENDLKELKELIISNQQALETKLNAIELGQAELKGEIKALEAKIQGLEKRVDDISGRLNVMTIGFLSIIGVLVAGILGIIGKVVFFSSNP